jgi:hypothetical protein
MSTGRPKTPRPTGARFAGDYYQKLFTWYQALHLLHKSEVVTRIEFEVRDAGNVDDVVVHERDRPIVYHQIKFVMGQIELLTHDWFIAIERGKKSSLLRRFYESFNDLSTDQKPAELALWTNRQLTADDPILRHLDSRTDRLGARFFDAGEKSATGEARRAWADHLGVDESELNRMLEHLRIYPGRDSLEQLERACGIYMEAVGLRGDATAVTLGASEIEKLIISGRTELEPDGMRNLVERLGLAAPAPRATLLVQAIDRDSWPDSATATVDWVDYFDGSEPRERRQLIDPELWNTTLKPELEAAAKEIRRQGYTDVRVDGALRLSSGFAAGASLPRTAGLTVAFRDWVSTAAPADFPLTVIEHELGNGDELAVALCVTADITSDVLDYIERAGLPVNVLVTIAPSNGASQTSIPGETEALGFVYGAFDEIRARTGKPSKLHVFQANPNGISILLGHLWNRVPPTQLYDDANSAEGYFPTFLLTS